MLITLERLCPVSIFRSVSLLSEYLGTLQQKRADDRGRFSARLGRYILTDPTGGAMSCSPTFRPVRAEISQLSL
jgi:hypothetical protein